VKQNLFRAFSVLALTSMMLWACSNTPAATEPHVTTIPNATDVSTVNASAKEVPTSCTPFGTEPVPFPEGGKSITGALEQEPDFIVPYFSHIPFSISVTQLTLAGLGEWDDQNNLVPELAAEIPTIENGGVSEDSLTITWKLKDCLFWSDGVPLTSADVKFTWEAVMDPGNAIFSRAGYDKIEKVETPDDLTVVIKFAELYPPWQTLFTQGLNNSGAILPKHILEGRNTLEGDDFIHYPTVGSGPFVITEWVPGNSMTLLPNPNFYAGRAKLDRIQIQFMSNSAAVTALKTGNVDWYPNFSEEDISTLGTLGPKVHLLVIPGSNVEHYFFNMGRVDGVGGRGKADKEGFCPFKDIRVREAITLGINRQRIVDTLLNGKTTVPGSLWPDPAWINTNIQVKYYDPEAAATLLDEAGYSVGSDGIRVGDCNKEQVKLSFTFKTTTDPLRMAIAAAAKKDLAKIGIDLILIQIPYSTFFAQYSEGGTLATGDYDMAGYITGFYPDPYTNHFQCEAIPTAEKPNGLNWYHLCDPFLSDLMDSLLTTADPMDRKAILDEAQIYIAENYYVIPIYIHAGVFGYSDRFVIGPVGPQSGLNWNAEVWDIKE
jgi:peptide/nickel transport system substrate-binding protein